MGGTSRAASLRRRSLVASAVAVVLGCFAAPVASAETTTTATASSTSTTTSSCTSIPTVPESQTVSAGSTVTFAVFGFCPGTTYQWLVSTNHGASFAPIPGATSSTLTIPDVTVADNGNEYELSGTLPATLTVTATCTSIPTVPESQTVSAGSTVTFSVDGFCPGTTYQWLVFTNHGASFAPIPGATSSTLTITDVTVADNGNEYELSAIEPGGASSLSLPATLTVTAAPAPVVSAVFPSSGSTNGGLAIIFGSHLGSASVVSFEATQTHYFLELFGFVIITVVPPHAAGPVDVTVTGPGGTSATSPVDRYTYR